MSGKVGEAGQGLVIAYPEHDTLQARRLRVALAQAPWKYRVVHLAAEQRREQGGDLTSAESSAPRTRGPRRKRFPA